MTLPQLMSGVQLIGTGGPEMLRWSDTIALPKPAPDEALVQVLAAGVNMTDVNTRTGWYARDEAPEGGWAGAMQLPRIQGADLCGRLVALGADTGDYGIAIGARVICATCQSEPTPQNPMALRVIGSEYDGAFAQFCTVPLRHLHDVSASPLSDTELGAMPCAYGTAQGMLDRAKVTAGDRVLVTGSSGGVGLAAVQLAVGRGAKVVGQCSPAKADAVRGMGADVLARDATPDPASFTVVIDLVGGPGWARRIEALRPGGRYAVAGAVGGHEIAGDLRTIYLNDLSLFGCTNQSPASFAGLVALIASATPPRPLVSRTYPLADIAEVQSDLVAGRFPGKLVLIPPEVAA